MSYFMAYTQQRPDGAVQAAIEQAKTKAIQEFTNLAFQGEYPDTGYGIVTIRPKHVGAGYSHWSGSHWFGQSLVASVTWEDWINVLQTELAFEIITGLWNYEATPKVTEVYIQADGRDFPTINIEEMYSYDVARVFLAKPITISPRKQWYFFSKAINTGQERQGLLGYTLGTRSYLILRA